LRSAALVLAAVALIFGCTPPQPEPSPSSSPPEQASDLRTQLDLLLTEHVMILAKESAAALNGSPAYRAYATLLTTNQSAMTELLRRAVGNTAANGFSTAWTALNADLVDYAIRVATHQGDQADADTQRLTDTTMPALAVQLANVTLGQAQPFLDLVTAMVTSMRDTIDGAANHQYTAMYLSLGNAVGHAVDLGDTIAAGIVHRFTDRFPGDQASQDAARRARLNVLLQERAYLATMATDAQLNGRTAEAKFTLQALSANLDFVMEQLDNPGLRQLWTDELASIQVYAKNGDSASKQALSQTFVNRLVSMTGASANVVTNQVDATIKVLDDQRTKNADDIADDDRAAATATAPIADAL
jgi:hypothetical protein